MVSYREFQYKCLFVSWEWKEQQIALEHLFAFETLLAIESTNNWIDWVLTNCNKDTLLFPSIPNSIHAIKWSKITDENDLFPDNETTISVILKSKEWVIYYVANMNLEAFRNSKRDSKLWVYSKTNKQLQQKWATSWDFINLDPNSFVKWVNSDKEVILMVNVEPINPSVCHVKNPETEKWYPTCFFRPAQEFLEKVNLVLKNN